MEKLPCQGCRGLCCGPVPITEQELKTIKKHVKAMPRNYRSTLQSQDRHYGTCIFYDLDRDKCGVHPARPAVCRAFGYHNNLVCFRKPELATKPNYAADANHIGVLSLDITWNNFT